MDKFDLEQEYLIFSTNNNIIKKMNLETQKIEFIQGHSEVILGLDYFEDKLVSASKDKTIKYWKIKDSKFQLIATYLGHTEVIQ